MKTFKHLAHEMITKVDEDAPTNAVGTGANVALPPTHEPGVDKKKKKKKHDPILINTLKRKVEENNDNNSTMLKGVLDKLEQLDTIVDEVSGVKKTDIFEQDFQSEYTTFKDKYMGQLLNETDTAAAKEMEQLLVDCARNVAKDNNYNKVKKKMGRDGDPVKLGKSILTKIGNPTSGMMMKSGDINGKVWGPGPYEGEKQWIGTQPTAKTDIILDKMKISLKTGSAQLMSGTPEETESTMRYAIRKVGEKRNRETENISNNIVDEINKLLRSGELDPKFPGGVDFQKKGGTIKYFVGTKPVTQKVKGWDKGDIDAELQKADNFNLKFKDELSAFFNNNLDFKTFFVYEAMTGETKFDKGDATADHFLVVDYSGNANLHQVRFPGSNYVNSILRQVKPDVKFKTAQRKRKIDGTKYGQGFYSIRSVVGLGYKAIAQAQNECFEMTKDTNFLTEGIIDRIKSIWAKTKNFISGLIRDVKLFLSKSISNIMEFLGVEPEVRFNNTVRW